MMNTTKVISSELDLHSKQTGARPLSVDQPAYYGDGPTRGLPDWMVLRIARWNLPAPLTMIMIGAVLLGAIIAPIFAAAGLLGWLLAGAIAGAAAVVMIAKWRILGLAALPIAALMVPYAIGTGSQTGINPAVLLLLLLLALWLLDMIARHRQIRLLTYRPVIASLVFSVVAVVAFGFGQLPWFSTRSASMAAQIAGLLIFLFSMGAFLLVAHQIRTIIELQWMTWIFLGVGLIFFAIRLFPSLQPIMTRIFARQGVLGAAFYVWLVAMALSQALFNPKLARGWRVLAGVLVLLIFYVNMKGDARFWISGWLPSMVVLVTVILLGRPDWGMFAVTISGVILLFNTDIITRITNEGDNTYSTITRLEAWRIMVEIIKANPVFGLGMANYYFYTPLFPILGYRISFNSHNNYIDIVAQTGLVGLVCFLWFFAELGLLGLHMRTRVPEGFPRAYVIGAMGGLAGTIFLGLLGDWVIPFVYNIGLEGFRASMFVFLFLGGLVAVAKLYNIDPGRRTGSSLG